MFEDRNDDEAEREALLAEDRSKASSTFSTPHGFSTPKSVASDISSPQKEHFQGCLKLYAENKINKDNAWNLQLIDFMSAMLRKHDSRMENLQMASTTLDASARIYSFRVDAIHHDVLIMAGGLSKAAQTKRGKNPENEENIDPNENAEADKNTQKKKEKRKRVAKSSIAANIQTQLNTEIDVNECIDPFFAQLAATTGDMTSSNKAFNATLPIDEKVFGIVLRSDVKFLYLDNDAESVLDINNLDMFECKKKFFFTVKEDDKLCAPFHGFSIKDWNPEEEELNMKNNVNLWGNDNLNLSHQAMAFDINADVEPLPNNNMDGFIYDEPHDAVESDAEEEGVTCNAVKRDKSKIIANLVDMRPANQLDAFLEYSYSSAVIDTWAGPSHWKLKNNINTRSRLPEKCQTLTTVITKKATSKKKRILGFHNEGMSFNIICNKNPEYETIISTKIMVGRKTLVQGATWNEKRFKIPVDRGYNMSHFRKLYFKQSVVLSLACNAQSSGNNECQENKICEINEYDYNNDNDTSYCPNSQPDNDDGEPWLEDMCCREPKSNEGMDMVEPPPKVAKLFIPYAMRAKKVDMKQLKSVIWKMLVPMEDEREKDNSHIKNIELNFNTLYEELPPKLSTNMKESLSVSLSLLAVLHLANEKGLSLTNNSDFTNFSIVPT